MPPFGLLCSHTQPTYTAVDIGKERQVFPVLHALGSSHAFRGSDT